MGIPLHSFAQLYDLLYSDTLTVKRYSSKTNTDGTEGTNLIPTLVYSAVPCRLSYGNEDNSNPVFEDKNRIYKPITVFCNPSYVIQKGDLISVERKTASGTSMVIFEGISNKPSNFETHTELTFAQTGVA